MMKWIFRVSAVSFYSVLAFAGSSPENLSSRSGVQNVPQSQWYGAVQLGGQGARKASTTSLQNGSGFPTPYDQDIYTASHRSLGVLLGLEAGQRWRLSYDWFRALSLGLRYQYFMNTDISGEVIQFSLPQFTNYNYKWQSMANLVLASAKINLKPYQRFAPYVQGGLGGVVFSNGKYSESALADVTPRISPNYASASETQFAYQLGVGIDYQFSAAILLNAGYQFSNLAKMRSGYGTDRWSGERLDFGRVQANALLLGMTYLFDASDFHKP